MAFISKSTIANLNSRLDAISVIGDYVRLDKKSGRWWGRCPFHGGGQEKTPSFKVDPDSKLYHCFGCGKGGTVIGFVMEMDKLTYPEAIVNLAKKTGVEIVYEEGSAGDVEKENTVRDELFEIYRRTATTFQHFLKEKQEGYAALDFLRKRGINKEMIDLFKLGFSPLDRDFLFNFLRQKGYSDDFLDKSGLFSLNYKKSPFFSGRLMFPISDRQGRIVAFGGRSIPEISQNIDKEQAKYINSRESEIYKKGQTLFAIDHAKSKMRQSKTVFLAEGYLDVIALHQAGISNAVAPLGTAFTDEQAVWLRRWVDNVVLLFDTDEAGKKASYKAIITCRKNGISCTFVDLQEGLIRETGAQETINFKDPADILQGFGAEVLKNILKFTINDFEYLISLGKYQYISVEGDVNKAAQFMFPYLEALDSEVDRSDSITRIADIFKIERNAVQKDFSEWRNKEFSRNTQGRSGGVLAGSQIQQSLKIQRNAELGMLTNVAVNMELYPEFRAAVEIKDIDDKAAKEIFVAMEECFKHDEYGIDFLLTRIEYENLRNFVAAEGTSREYSVSSGRDPRKVMEDGIKLIRKKKLEKRLTEINAQMRESERTSSEIENIDDLLAEKKMIDSYIQKL